MKKILLFSLFSFLIGNVFSQQISKITLGTSGALESISITIADNAIINMKEDGSIINFGLPRYNRITDNYGDYTDLLDPFVGRIEYYSNLDNEAFRGKVKYIGKTQITYFASYDDENLRGKIRSIGTILLGYFMNYEDKDVKGKLRKIGAVDLDYFTSFDNEAFRGKLRAVGATNLTYYASYDDKAFAGRIKSIGNFGYTYYSSYDRVEYRGARKTGLQQQLINGIKYYAK
jgi:hypothetical protein